MADFVLKRKPGFRFKIEGYPEEGAEKVFTIPAPSQLSFEDVEKIRKLAETEDVRKHGAAMKSFLLSHCPELEKAINGEMEYMNIFNAYADATKNDASESGESSASADS